MTLRGTTENSQRKQQSRKTTHWPQEEAQGGVFLILLFSQGLFFIPSQGESPAGIPPKKKQLPVQSQRQPECEQHLQGEEICDTEVTPEAVSQFPLLHVKGDKMCCSVIAGRIQHFLGKWIQLTYDPSILNAVRGYKIDFLLTPVQFTIPRPINFSVQESVNVDAQISKFLEKGS